MGYLYILGCVACTVAGQLAAKTGSGQVKGQPLYLIFLNGWIIAAYACAFLASLSWIKALEHFALSFAYPFMSLSFPLVAICSIFVFGESVKPHQWIGLTVVLAGLFIGSR